jgi:hypothetical protein
LIKDIVENTLVQKLPTLLDHLLSGLPAHTNLIK